MAGHANKPWVRFIANENAEGVIQLSQPFIGTVEDMKGLCRSYDLKPLYTVRLTSVRKGAPGHFEWTMFTLGLDFSTHGHA